MSGEPAGAVDRAVLVPTGAPILEAARWVAVSCRAELALHERLTALLRGGSLPDSASVLWTVRAHRAELAEAWHRRLPELREFPRETLLAEADDPVPSDDPSLTEIRERLDELEARYLAHLDRAVGPADGPVADLLVRAIAVTADDRLVLG